MMESFTRWRLLDSRMAVSFERTYTRAESTHIILIAVMREFEDITLERKEHWMGEIDGKSQSIISFPRVEAMRGSLRNTPLRVTYVEQRRPSENIHNEEKDGGGKKIF